MRHARLFLLCALALTLTSCASLRKDRIVYQPPRVDCEALAVPRVAKPSEPTLSEKSPVIWQLYAWGWQAFAEDVLMQRVETANCLQTMKKGGAIR